MVHSSARRPAPIRIGLLGAAKIAPKAILTPAAARDDVTVTAIAARDPARARAFAEAHGIAAFAENYRALIARDDVDVVYVGLPISAHAEWSVAALEAGKAVLCEKAFALDAAEARTMVAAGEAAGRPLLEAIHNRFHRVIRRAEEIVRSGELGPLVRASAMFDAPIFERAADIRWKAALGGGALGDLGCYAIHALRTLIGAEPEVKDAKAEMRDGVDAATWARLEFPGGVPAEISCSMLKERAAALVIEGERGRLEIEGYVAPQITGCRFVVEVDERAREEAMDGPTTYDAQLDHLVQVMRKEAEPLTGGADAIANLVVMDAIRAGGA